MKNNKKKFIFIISIIGLFIGGIALSFAYFNISGKQDNANTLEVVA